MAIALAGISPVCVYHGRDGCKACLAFKGAVVMERHAREVATGPERAQKAGKAMVYLDQAVGYEAAGV
jgi:hypothetical protein